MTGKIEWLRGKDQAWVEPERNPQLQLQVPLRLEEENQEHIREENRTLRCRRCPVKLSMLRCKTGSLSGVRAPLSKSSHVFVAGHGVIGRTHTTINSAEFCVWRQPSLVRMLQAQELDMGLVFPASVPHPKPSSGAYSSRWMKSHFPMSWWEALGFGPQGRHFTVFLSYCAVLEMCYIITRGFVVYLIKQCHTWETVIFPQSQFRKVAVTAVPHRQYSITSVSPSLLPQHRSWHASKPPSELPLLHGGFSHDSVPCIFESLIILNGFLRFLL
jgi:hypothetical protein